MGEPLGVPVDVSKHPGLFTRRLEIREEKASNVLEIPEPEVRATVIPLEDDGVPRGCRTIAKLAQKHGFTVVLHYARGPWIGDNPVRVLRICQSIVLRMRHEDGRRAVAQWATQTDPTEWKLEGSWLLRPFLQSAKSDELKAYLREPVDDPARPLDDTP